MNLLLLPDLLAIARYPVGTVEPTQPVGGGLWAEIWTAEGLTVVGDEKAMRGAEGLESDWRALMVEGPLDFSLVGVLADLLEPLRRAGISVFVISSFETDYVLVRAEGLQKAMATLEAAGHTIQLG